MITNGLPLAAALVATTTIMATKAEAGDVGACFLPLPNNCCADLSTSDCTTAGGSFQGVGTACHGSEVVADASNLNMAMPDNDPLGISHTIEIAEHFVVSDVAVVLGITHTWVGDLCVTLEHNGVVVALIERPGEAGGCHQGFPFGCDTDNYVDIVITDGGKGGAIEDQCQANLASPPSFSPNQPMLAFEGMNAAGAWTLTVSDNAAGDLGMLTGWTIDLVPGPSCAGACCLEFDCMEEITPAECDALGGFDFQPLKTCLEGCYGACCDDSGCYDCTCLGDDYTELGCINSLGFFNGPGTHCVLSPGDYCNPLEKGACCLPTGNCMVMLPEECNAANGNFEGLLTTCSIPPCQACCLGDGTCLYTADETTCLNAGGTFEGYSMPGGNGGFPLAPIKACCFDDGRCCRRLTQEICEAEGGTFQAFGNCQNCPGTSTCPWDLNESGDVEVLDLVDLIGNWGPCPGGCAQDFDDNEDVGVLDLVAIIQNWGMCPPAGACDG